MTNLKPSDKALVPFVFVYSPSLLLVADGFTWSAFAITLTGAMIGIGCIGAAFSGYIFATMRKAERWYVGLVGLLFVAPGLLTMGIGIVLLPVLYLQWQKRDRGQAAA